MKRKKYERKRDFQRPTKYVRIDPRTVIEADAGIPDSVVKESYLNKIQGSMPSTRLYDRESKYFIH